jgi:hypothetical protein
MSTSAWKMRQRAVSLKTDCKRRVEEHNLKHIAGSGKDKLPRLKNYALAIVDNP